MPKQLNKYSCCNNVVDIWRKNAHTLKVVLTMTNRCRCVPRDIPGSPCEFPMAPLGALVHSLGTTAIQCCCETVICGSPHLHYFSMVPFEVLVSILSGKPFWQSGHLSLLLRTLLRPFASRSSHSTLSIPLLICISVFYFLTGSLLLCEFFEDKALSYFSFHPQEAGRVPRTNE